MGKDDAGRGAGNRSRHPGKKPQPDQPGPIPLPARPTPVPVEIPVEVPVDPVAAPEGALDAARTTNAAATLNTAVDALGRLPAVVSGSVDLSGPVPVSVDVNGVNYTVTEQKRRIVNDNNPYNGDRNKRWEVFVDVTRAGAAAAGVYI